MQIVSNIKTINSSFIMNSRKEVEMENDIVKIRNIIANAKARGNEEFAARAERHLSTLVGFHNNEIDRRFLKCLKIYESILTSKNDRKTFARRTRNAVDNKGVKATIEMLVMKDQASFGFDNLIAAGEYKSTVEFLVIELWEQFDIRVVRQAYAKLRKSGVRFTNGN
jgi:uncharacterized UPF0160 family protein